MSVSSISRRRFLPVAAGALFLAIAIPSSAALAAAPKPPTLDLWVVTASHRQNASVDGGKHDESDAGRTVPPELTSWGELASDPLAHFAKFELVDHVRAPLVKDKPFKYQIKGEASVYEITLLGIEEPSKNKPLAYNYRITFPSPEGKAESLLRVTRQGERTIIRDRGFKGAKHAVRFIAVAVGP